MASQYTGSSAGPSKKGLAGVPLPHNPPVAMNTGDSKPAVPLTSFLFLCLFLYSCSSCVFTVAHMVASRSGNCWTGSRSAKRLAQVNKHVSKDEIQRGAGLSPLETSRGPRPALQALHSDVLHMAMANQRALFAHGLLYSCISKHFHFPNFPRLSPTVVSRSGFLPNSFKNIVLSMLRVHLCVCACVCVCACLTQRADVLPPLCPVKCVLSY